MTDPDEALRFLALLGKDPTTARFRFFAHKHNPRKKEIGARKLVGFDPERIAQYQREGRGAYLAIGNSDGSGDDKKNILTIPALFNEWDDKPIAWQRTAWKELGLPEPSVQLETGGASIHSYWLLDKPLARDEWEPLQGRLIKHSGSDPACSDASRVMRLPGAWYMGPDGQRVAATKIISDSGKRYTLQELLACMPDLQQELAASPSPPSPQARTYPPRPLEQVREALQFIPEILPGTNQRDTFLKLAWGLLGAVREASESDAMALALLEEHSPQVVDAAEYLKTEPTEITASTFWGMARKAGWRPASVELLSSPAAPRDGIPLPASSSTANVDQVVDGLPDHGDSSQQQGQQRRSNDLELLTYSQLIRDALNAIRNGSRDREMACRAEIKGRFRCSDAQITKALIEELTRDEAGTSTPCTYGTVDLDRTAGMDWLVEGFIPANDQVLLYGEAGAGKTTAAIGLAFAVIDGTGFLDRASCAPRGSVLFIASDSGADPLRTALQGMGLLDHPALAPDAPHRFFVWAHDAEQGRMAWDASLPGLIALQDFIRENRIQLVLIDSAKAVTSKADLNYCENGPVTALLTFAKESLCRFCSIVWLHHDGTAKGSAAGAKAWKEVPSAVHAIEKYVIEGSGDERNGGGSRGPSYTSDLMRVWTVKKCRLGTHREFKYELDSATGRPVLIPGAAGAVVHDARAAIVEVLSQAWQNGCTSLSRQELASKLRQRWSYSGKTTDNNLSRMVSARHPEVCRLSTPRGHYKLAPRVVEVLRAAQLANPSLNTSLLEGKEQGQTPVPDCDLVISREVPSGTQGNSAEFPREKLGNSQPASAGKGSDLVPSHGTFTPRARAQNTVGPPPAGVGPIPPPAELLAKLQAKLQALRLNNPKWSSRQLADALDPLGNHGIDEQTVRGWLLNDQPSAA